MSELYIGLMSGTSVDGIDAALVDFSDEKLDLIAFDYQPFAEELKTKIRHISSANQPLLLSDYGALDCELGHLFANSVNNLLKKSGISATEIKAIGSHGQTVYHQPNTALPFSLQIGDPNLIAQKTGITTIADFRRRDMAAGGQGAPLAPAFHQAVFSQPEKNITVLNIGGIANITVLSQNKIIAFDTGTGNTLMDYWIKKHLNQEYDKNGDWARTGTVIPKLLAQFKQADYFAAPPPKSTGKEYFSVEWLENHLNHFSNLKAEDVQTTLCHLTAETINEAISNHAPNTEQVLVCGGGVHNTYLMELLATKNDRVSSTEDFGVHPDHVEAIAFAWLARQTMNHLAGNLTDVTGAKTPVVLGGIYLAADSASNF
jgi:anhydro-N-acetylmuramic acid kinase